MHTILPEENNPVLRGVAHEIPLSEIKSPKIQNLIAEMKELLSHEEYGVALAAPQLGEPIKLFIVSGRAIARGRRNAPDEESPETDTEPLTNEPDQVYINPELFKVSRKKIGKHEGCLSIRGKWGIVPRAEKASIRGYDEHGKKVTRGASGFLAHIFQHEIDHLDGVLYIDKATKLYDDDEKD